jgi:hypothetical protein
VSDYTPTTDDQMRLAFVLSIPRPESGGAWDRWLAAHDRKVAAKAWDEGFWAGMPYPYDYKTNPYREDVE